METIIPEVGERYEYWLGQDFIRVGTVVEVDQDNFVTIKSDDGRHTDHVWASALLRLAD